MNPPLKYLIPSGLGLFELGNAVYRFFSKNDPKLFGPLSISDNVSDDVLAIL